MLGKNLGRHAYRVWAAISGHEGDGLATKTVLLQQQASPKQSELGGTRWGELPSETRKIELAEKLRAWKAESDHGDRIGPFAGLVMQVGESRIRMGESLTGAEVFWLAVLAVRDVENVSEDEVKHLSLSELHHGSFSLQLNGANLNGSQLQGANLSEAQLQDASLIGTQLQGASLTGAQLQRAKLLGAQLQRADLRMAKMQNANLSQARLEEAVLIEAQMERVNFDNAQLQKADLSEAQLQGAIFFGADLRGADFNRAQLQNAIFVEARMDEVNLYYADLRGGSLNEAQLHMVDLRKAQLQGTIFFGADLRGANFSEAHLESGVSLAGTALSPADLRATTLDARTNLAGVTLGDIEHGFVSVADTAWNGVNLANVGWDALCSPGGQLGDEQRAHDPQHKMGGLKTPGDMLAGYQEAVRAYRQLSVALQAQGLTEQSVWLGYRAQKLHHTVLTLQLAYLLQTRRQGSWWRRVREVARLRGRVLFSRVLDRVAGYGYKPRKSVTSYLMVQLIFIVLYLLIGLQNFVATGHHLPGGSTPLQAAWAALLEACILSVTSFHGRAFLPGSTGNFVNNVPLPTTLMFGGTAAVEAIVGLLIEAILVATLIQRFFR